MIYLHVPFCESRCTYCGFFSTVILSEAPNNNTVILSEAPKNKENVILSEAKNLCTRAFYEAYADAVCEEIKARRDEIAETLSVNTLYIGGGTPSVLPLEVLSRIVLAISSPPEGAVTPNHPRSALRPVSPSASHPFMWPRAATGSAATPLPDVNTVILSEAPKKKENVILSEAPKKKENVILSEAPKNKENVILSEAKNLSLWEEFTVEVNPEDIVEKGEEYVEGLKSLGINRISMGVQSFDDRILRWMNRRHDSATADEAFRILRRCGIGNISLDLIFGLSQLDQATWIDTIDKTLSLKPEHISAYQLSIEEDSALEELIARGKYSEATEDQCRRQYDVLCAKLNEAGYRHYEISNFALPGFEAVHNSAYWRRVPYVGLGPGAHSLSITCAENGTYPPKTSQTRSWNSWTIPRRLGDGTLATYSREQEILSPEDIRVERIMLPLRTDTGLPEAELRSLADPSTIDRLLSEGALVRTQDPSVASLPQDDKGSCCHPAPLSCHPERSEGSLRIPEDRLFTSDDIIRQLI